MCGYVSGNACLLSAHMCAFVEPMSVHASRLPLSLSILGDRVCHLTEALHFARAG